MIFGRSVVWDNYRICCQGSSVVEYASKLSGVFLSFKPSSAHASDKHSRIADRESTWSSASTSHVRGVT